MSIILYSRSRRRRFPEGQDSLTAIAKRKLQIAKSFSPPFAVVVELESNLQNTVKKIENGKQKFPVPISQFQRANVLTCKRANVPI